jgi:hypothetical protein
LLSRRTGHCSNHADKRDYPEESHATSSSAIPAAFGVVFCAALGGAIAVAQASDSAIKQTLNRFSPKIAKDENAVKTGLQGYPQGKFRPLTRALQHEISDLHALKSQLSHESASSASGASAKTDIITGLGMIASAYAALRRDFLAAHGGPVAAAKVTAAVNTDKEGRKKLQAGLKLLDTPSNPTPTPTPTGCHPIASTGNCYEPGEYCPTADHGMTGVAGDGKTIICEDNNGWRWEPE